MRDRGPVEEIATGEGEMSARRGLRVLCVGLMAGIALGAAPVAAAEGDVDERMDALERELEALKRDRASEEGAGQTSEAAQQAESEEEKKSFPPVLQVTDNITFRPGLRIQGRYSWNQQFDNRFQIRRLRMKFQGAAFDLLKYYAEVKIDGTGTGSPINVTPTPRVENAWVEFNKLPHTNLRVGQYDIPFSRDALTSDSKLLFMDRSLIKIKLTRVGFADNTIGFLFHEMPLDGKLEYGAGIFQNNVFAKVPTLAGRLAVNLLDPARATGKRGSYANYRGSYHGEGRRLTIGANGAYTPAATSPVTNNTFDLYAFGGDIFFNTGPFTLQAEFDWYRKDMSRTTGTTGDIDVYGGYVQGGVLLNPVIDRLTSVSVPPIELAARYQDVHDEEFIVNLSPFSTVTERQKEMAVGMNVYLYSHRLKMQADYAWKTPNRIIAGRTGNNDTFQLQLQLDF